MTATTWGPAYELAFCKRCGKTGKVPAGSRRHNRNIFCSRQCEVWHNEELRVNQLDRQAARNYWSHWKRREVLRTTPLHELYPSMLGVLAAVQAQRPSYCRWVGCGDQ